MSKPTILETKIINTDDRVVNRDKESFAKITLYDNSLSFHFKYTSVETIKEYFEGTTDVKESEDLAFNISRRERYNKSELKSVSLRLVSYDQAIKSSEKMEIPHWELSVKTYTGKGVFFLSFNKESEGLKFYNEIENWLFA